MATFSSSTAIYDILAPLTPEAFLSQYWERRPLHIKGQPDKFAGLFDMDAFWRAIQQQHQKGLSIRVSFDSESDTKGVGTHLFIDHAQVKEYMDRGASVCVDPIDRADAKLGALAASVKSALNHAGGISVKCYISPDKCGFNTHFDVGIATTLQLSGRKRWRFSRQAGVAFPTDNAMVSADGSVRYAGRLPSSIQDWEQVAHVGEADFDEVVLEPGDVLCLPGGVWHNAKAVGHSMALNVSFAPLNFWDLMQRVLGPLLAANPEWRRSLPAVLANGASDHPPAEVLSFFQQRLAELQQTLAALEPAGAVLQQAWQSAVTGELTRPVAPARTAPPPQRPPQPAASQPPTAAPSTGRGALGYDGGLSCTIFVKNLKAAVDWYQRALGFQALYTVPEFGWCEMASQTQGVRIGLSEIPVPGVNGAALLNFGVVDIKEAHRRLTAEQVHIEGPIQEIIGMTKLLTFYDPDGNRLMLYESQRA